MERRGNGARRLVMVVDETGQYVARSRTRMLALQGLAEAVQKQQGRLFLVTTSQERLEVFGEAIWGVYDLRQLWKSLGPRQETIVKGEQPGRNDPCPCGSGKKYKKCHGV